MVDKDKQERENERLAAFIGFGCLMAALALICKLFGWAP